MLEFNSKMWAGMVLVSPAALGFVFMVCHRGSSEGILFRALGSFSCLSAIGSSSTKSSSSSAVICITRDPELRLQEANTIKEKIQRVRVFTCVNPRA